MTTNTILVCDDDAAVRSSLSLVLKRGGYGVDCASCPQEAIDYLRAHTPQLLLVDMNYTNATGGEEGLELLRQAKLLKPNIPVILVTAWGSISLAVRGIQAGAFDFVVKPWNNLALLNIIQTAIQLNADKTEELQPAKGNYSKIIGRSPLLQTLFTTIDRIAQTNAPVLILGESGTGKELIAEAIHENSLRRKEPFVKVNLGGISQTLFESEMFGHKKGAFTDAHYDRKGRFETADKGSIFLDEIGELDLICQVKLLRVLQDQTFEPLGESRTKKTNVRVISATNRNLSAMIAKNAFREDLFYRINLISLQVPALRERREDIPLLAEHFAREQAKTGNLPQVELSSEAIRFLQSLPYPGNIRELKNLVDRTILVSRRPLITDAELKSQYTEIPPEHEAPLHSVCALEDMERRMIRKAMNLYGGNLSKVALALGLSRQAVYRRLEKYGIKQE
jgi:two-component system NtrC family response regulator